MGCYCQSTCSSYTKIKTVASLRKQFICILKWILVTSQFSKGLRKHCTKCSVIVSKIDSSLFKGWFDLWQAQYCKVQCFLTRFGIENCLSVLISIIARLSGILCTCMVNGTHFLFIYNLIIINIWKLFVKQFYHGNNRSQKVTRFNIIKTDLLALSTRGSAEQKTETYCFCGHSASWNWHSAMSVSLPVQLIWKNKNKYQS